jgi:hypothetical protein
MENQFINNQRRPMHPMHPKYHKWGLILLIAIVIILFIFMMWKIMSPKRIVQLDLSGIDFPRGLPDMNF